MEFKDILVDVILTFGVLLGLVSVLLPHLKKRHIAKMNRKFAEERRQQSNVYH